MADNNDIDNSFNCDNKVELEMHQSLSQRTNNSQAEAKDDSIIFPFNFICPSNLKVN